MNMLPMPDKVIVIKVLGATFKEALENGVSAWPKYDGRFPSVSGVRFRFDPSKEPGNRINLEDIETESGPLDPSKEYTVAMKSFIACGKDGYTMFQNEGTISYVIDEERASLIQDVLYQFFESFGPEA